MPGLRDLRPLVRPVYAPSLVYSIGVGAVVPATVLLGMRLGLRLGLDPSAIAAWVAVGALAAVAGSLGAGPVVDAVGERAALLGATAVSTLTLTTLCLAVWSHRSWSVAAFGVAVVVVALVDGVWAVARQAMLADGVPAGLRGRAMNAYGATQRLGRAAGPALAAGAILVLGPVAGFAVHAVSAVVACALIVRALPPGPACPAPNAATQQLPPARYPRAAFWLVGAGALAIEALRANRDLITPLTRSTFWIGIALIGLGKGIGAGIVKTLAVHLAPQRRRATFLGRWTALSATGSLAGPALVVATPDLAAAVTATMVLGAAAAIWLAVIGPRHVHRPTPDLDPAPQEQP